ncbi:MAG: pyridoxal-dependent decarboxylase, exosortase A system-associated, partial [Sphingomonadaceae bacterium]
KANPFAPLLQLLAPLVDGFDVASAGELALVPGDKGRVGFAGPGKRDRELAAAIAAGATISLESPGEAGRALAIAQGTARPLHALLRVNPPFELRGSGMRMGGGARAFGVDLEQAPDVLAMLAAGGAHVRGFHIFAGSQNLDAEAIADAQAATVTLAAELAAHLPGPPELVNLGGGFGLPYFAGDRPLDLARIGARLSETLARRHPVLRDTRFALELGRFLVGEAGVYLMRVVDRKVSGGQTFLVTDGGLHHQLAATGNFGTVVRRSYPIANASRSGPAVLACNIVGCLCTPLDRFGEGVELPDTREGDLLAVFLAGAYGRTASPEAFLGHPPAAELLVGA